MSESLQVRRATREDADSLVEFNAAMAAETEDRALDSATLRAGVDAVFDDEARGFYLVAEHDGRAAGALMVTFEWSEWRNAPFWWIQSVYVAPDARGRGVYRALHARVESEARSAGACGLRLYVEKENDRARRVYEFLGMRETVYDMLEVEF
jgi:GNAT superfamily N-acetyltransferase